MFIIKGSRSSDFLMDKMKKAKVAYILYQFPVLSETFLMDEILQLKKMGMDISIFLFKGSYDKIMHKEAEALIKDAFYASDPKADANSFVKVVKSNLNFLFRAPLKYIYFVFKYAFKIGKKEFLQIFYLCRLIEMQKPRHLHAHFAGLPATAAMIAARFLGIPFSFTVHAHDIFVKNDFLEDNIKNAKFIIAISKYDKDYLLKRFRNISSDKIKVIHCGIDIERFKPQISKTSKTAVILSGGRLIEKKGFSYLIKACRLLSKKGIRFRCDIFGDGPLKESFLNEINESGMAGIINLLGAIDRDKLLQLLNESDIFVLPSVIARDGDMDGIPVTLMEAMACQKPVISTNISGVPELVDSMENGILVPEKNIAELAQAIETLFDNKGLKERLGLKARQKIIEEFNINKNIDMLAKSFESI